jgi:flagellar assembly factor FliW
MSGFCELMTMTETEAEAPMSADSGKVLEFRDGIPGFPGSRRFVLTDLSEDGSFQLLQSLDEHEVAMVVSVPWPFFPDYAPELGDEETRELELAAPNEAIVFCPVTLDQEATTVYFNLLGPFIVNARTRKGRQVVLADATWPLRAPLPLGTG